MSAGRSSDRGVSGSTNESSQYKRSSSPQVVRAGAYPYPREPPTSYHPAPYGALYAGTKVGNDFHRHQFDPEYLRRRPTMLQDYHASSRESYIETDPVAVAVYTEAVSGSGPSSGSKKMKLEVQSFSQRQLPLQQQPQMQQQQQAGTLHLQHSHRSQPREQQMVPSWAQPLSIDTTGNSNGGGGSDDADASVKEEPGYHPKIEAISPTLPTSEDTKAELVQSIGKMDREIGKVESQIAQLKKKQQQLEEEASMPNVKTKEEAPEVVFSQSRPLSIAQIVYTENRSKAQRAHNILSGLGSRVDLPLYNLPSDALACAVTCERFSKFKSKLVDMFKSRHMEQRQQEKFMIDKYAELMQSWTKKLDAKTAKKKVKEQKTREYFERMFPELKKQRDDKDRFQSRVGSRSVLGGYARSEAELEQIMDSLHEQEEEEKKMRAYAVIPPIMPECRGVRTYRYVNRNSLVEDPMAEHKEMLLCMNMWSEQEKETFKEKYLQHPKNFVFISTYLPKKSVAECVRYYYLTKNAEKYKSLLKKQRAVNTKKRLPPRQQLRPFIKTEKDVEKNEEEEETDELPMESQTAPQVSAEGRGTGNCHSQSQQQVTDQEQYCDLMGPSNSALSRLQQCAACSSQLGSTAAGQHAVSRANCEAYGIKDSEYSPDIRVCSTCWRNSLRRRYSQCPILSCKTPKRRVKRLRQLPLKWSELPMELKESLMKELGVKDTVSKCCAACFSRISKYVGNNPRTNEPFLPLASEDCTVVSNNSTGDAGPLAGGAAVRWTDEEVEVAKQSLRVNGKNWAAVAATLGSKSEHQCRSFYMKYKKAYHLDDALRDYRRSKGINDLESGADSTSVSDDDDNGEDNGESTDSCETSNMIVDTAGSRATALPCATDQLRSALPPASMDTAPLVSKTGPAAIEEYDSSATASADELCCDVVASGACGSAGLAEAVPTLAQAPLSQVAMGSLTCSSAGCIDSPVALLASSIASGAMASQHTGFYMPPRDSGTPLKKDVKSVGDLINLAIEDALTDRQGSNGSPAYSSSLISTACNATDLTGASSQAKRQSTSSMTNPSGDHGPSSIDKEGNTKLPLTVLDQQLPPVFHPFASATSRLYMGDPRDYRSTGEIANVRAPPPAHSHHQQTTMTAGVSSVHDRSPLHQQPQNLVSRCEVKSSPSPRLAESSAAVSPALSPYSGIERQPSRSPGCRIPPPPPLIQTRTQPSYQQQQQHGSAAISKKDYLTQSFHAGAGQAVPVAGGSITQGTPLLAPTGLPQPGGGTHASPVTRYDQGSISQGTPRSHDSAMAATSKARMSPVLAPPLTPRGHLDMPLGMPSVSSPSATASASSVAVSQSEATLRAAAAMAAAQRMPFPVARHLLESAGGSLAQAQQSSMRAAGPGLPFFEPQMDIRALAMYANSGLPFPPAAAHFQQDGASQYTKATLQSDFFTAQQMKVNAADKDGKASPSLKEVGPPVSRSYPMHYYDPTLMAAAAAAIHPGLLSFMASMSPLAMQRDQQQHQHLLASHALNSSADAAALWSVRHLGGGGGAGVGSATLQNSASPARMSASPHDSHQLASRTPALSSAQQHRRSAESPSLAMTPSHQTRHPVIQGIGKHQDHALGRDSPSGAAFPKYDHRTSAEREPVDYGKGPLARRSGAAAPADKARAADTASADVRAGMGPSDVESGNPREDRLTILEQDRRTLASNSSAATTEQEASGKSEGSLVKLNSSYSPRNGPLPSHTTPEFASNRLAELSREMPHGALHKDASILFSASFEKDRNLQVSTERCGESMTAASLIDVIITKHINSDRPPSNPSDEPSPSATSVIVPPPKKQSKRAVSLPDDAAGGACMQDSAVSPVPQPGVEGSTVGSVSQLPPRGITLADHINDIINRDYGRKNESSLTRLQDASGNPPSRAGGIMSGSPVYHNAGRSTQTAQHWAPSSSSSYSADPRVAPPSPRAQDASVTPADVQLHSASAASGSSLKANSQVLAETRYDLEPISDDSNGESQELPVAANVAQQKQQAHTPKPGLAKGHQASGKMDSGMMYPYPHMNPHEFFANTIPEVIRRSAEQQVDIPSSAALSRHLPPPSVISSGYGGRHDQGSAAENYSSMSASASMVVTSKGGEHQSRHAMGGSSKSAEAGASAKPTSSRNMGSAAARGYSSSTTSDSQLPSTSANASRESPGSHSGGMRDYGQSLHGHYQLERGPAYHQLARHPSLTSLPTWAPLGTSGRVSSRMPTLPASSPPPLHPHAYAGSKVSTPSSQQQQLNMTAVPSGGFYSSLMNIASPGSVPASHLETIGRASSSADVHLSAMASRSRDSLPSPFQTRTSKGDAAARQGRGCAQGSDSPQSGSAAGSQWTADSMSGTHSSRFGSAPLSADGGHPSSNATSPQSGLHHQSSGSSSGSSQPRPSFKQEAAMKGSGPAGGGGAAANEYAAVSNSR